MDSFELNKIVGAVLFTLLVVMSLGIFAGEIYAPAVPEKPGFIIEVAEETTGGGGAAAAPQDPPIATLLASADVAAGENAAKKCAACHNFVEGAGTKVGPDLYNVIDRVIGSAEGFKYSGVMTTAHDEGKKWTYDHLYHFLKSPKADMPGTAMGFAGISKSQERANLIAYLRTLSHSPVPLPEPEAAAPAETAPAAGENPAASGGEAAPATDAPAAPAAPETPATPPASPEAAPEPTTPAAPAAPAPETPAAPAPDAPAQQPATP